MFYPKHAVFMWSKLKLPKKKKGTTYSEWNEDGRERKLLRKSSIKKEEENWVQKLSIIARKYTALLSDMVKNCNFICNYSIKSRQIS